LINWLEDKRVAVIPFPIPNCVACAWTAKSTLWRLWEGACTKVRVPRSVGADFSTKNYGCVWASRQITDQIIKNIHSVGKDEL